VGAFEVTPAALEQGAAQLVAGSIELGRIAARLDRVLTGAAGSVTGLATAAALLECRRSWILAVDALGAGVAELGGKAGGAGGRYTIQDAAVAGAAQTLTEAHATGPVGAR
jgi:hypothetical protein